MQKLLGKHEKQNRKCWRWYKRQGSKYLRRLAKTQAGDGVVVRRYYARDWWP